MKRANMLTDKMEYFSRQSKSFLMILAVCLCIALGAVDYLTGYEVSFSIFYLLPVSLIAWFVGRRPAIFIAIISALIWLLADLTSGHTYSHYAIPLWNSIMRLGFFLMAAYFLTAIRKLLDRVIELSRRDPLTGIANGRYFSELAANEINRASRFNRPLTLTYMDIDNFKQINDSLGHSTGDDLLHLVGETIKKNVRSIDIIARLGGDEFAILLPETGYEQSGTVIKKVQKYLLDAVQQKGWPVTFSFGVVTCNKPLCKVDELIKAADNLMYSVKNSGKNMIRHEVLDRIESGRV